MNTFLHLKWLNVCIKTIYSYLNTGKVFKDTYLINKINEKTKKIYKFIV